MMPNEPDAANLLIASLFHAGDQWLEVADAGRSAAASLW